MFALVLIAPVVILNRILRHETVGLETILGAICVYVLIAIAFAGIYAGVNDAEPSGFFAQQVTPTNVDFLYFSFVTITTVGYGDLTAGTSTGRVLVTFEALIGQIFLVTLVARLVSMYGVSRRPTPTTHERICMSVWSRMAQPPARDEACSIILPQRRTERKNGQTPSASFARQMLAPQVGCFRFV